MKTVIGLGNPGKEYIETRHNAGRLALEYFAKKNDFSDWEDKKKFSSLVSEGRIEKENALLLLPETFMNNSGNAVAFLKDKSSKSKAELIVLHDDIDLPLGKFKISFGRGSGGHKGVESIIRVLKTRDFWRIRIGVSAKRKPEHKKIPDFLTSPMRKPDLDTLKKTFKKISGALETILTDSPEKAMNLFN